MKKVLGFILVAIIISVIFFIACLPGYFIEPHNWFTEMTCILLFVVIAYLLTIGFALLMSSAYKWLINIFSNGSK